MQLPYSDNIEIQYLNRLFDNTSESYKFFWFQAIVTKVLEGKDTLTFDELLNEMIADAWYMVSEYHLNLGPKDNLEALVNHVKIISRMKSAEKKTTIIEYLKNCDDKEVLRLKRILITNVPYRLQAPFMPAIKGKAWGGKKEDLILRINEQRLLMYYFSLYTGLDTAITVQPEWIEYIAKNQEIVKGWLHYCMIIYLQKRNPSVPGIADKLEPPQERKLDKVKKYWKLILEIYPIHEIYANIALKNRDLSIDHFVPWSYVAHDELWNLHPTTRMINSKKSNRLPDWKTYFPAFCDLEYLSYTLMWQNERVHKEFERCADEHLNNSDIRYRLYRAGLNRMEFTNILSEVVTPVYQSAKSSGFSNWIYKEQQE